jgi:methylphosphotriester-DNA--protein-cysteine methyltransferase
MSGVPSSGVFWQQPYIHRSSAHTLRIEKARQQLDANDTKTDEINTEVGYDDPATFRGLFERTTGVARPAIDGVFGTYCRANADA